MSEATRRTRAQLAAAVRFHGPESVEATVTRRTHKFLTLEEAISECVSTAPPLTPEQLQRLASLLSVAEVEGA
ncbi:hypothetical protein ADK67_44170 [Saccharothrix sp. NRRL B-16348]|nr:hypothetical protein ADK67_44170 [Saccharothrix sp. NRRL B-16348]